MTTEQEALALLAKVKAKLGRNYKSAINRAWMTGDYHSESLSEYSCRLQNIRNSLGPSWLAKARPKSLPV